MTFRIHRRSFLAASGAALAFAPAVEARPRWSAENPIRLMFNENPYGPGPKARAAALKAVKREGALYPEDGGLRQKLADLYGLTSEHITISSGSTEMLMAAALIWGAEGKLVTPAPTYAPQFIYAEKKGVEIDRVPLDDQYANDLDALAGRAAGAGMVYVCNPNNPTGVPVDAEKLKDFCRSVGRETMVLVDEAYNEIVDKPSENTVLDLVREGENVIIVKTFSKIYGLAGLRVGYALGRPDLIKKLESGVMTWAPGPAVAAAEASLEDDEFYVFSRNKIIAGREKLYAACRTAGLDYVPSQTNFVFVNVRRDANLFAADILKKGVKVRGADYPPYTNYSRISAGRLEELDYFAKVLPSVV